MTDYLYFATKKGVSIARRHNGEWRTIRQALSGRYITSIVACKGLIAVGTREGVWRSVNEGQSWNEVNNNLSIRYVRWLASIPEAEVIVLAGTEPAGIFVSRDGADTWIASPEVGELRDTHGWFLPYSSGAGCVRGFAVSETGADRSRVYAAVEVGGVLVSNDYGDSWQLVKGSDGKPDMYRDLGTLIHPDVHSITVDPSAKERVTAATGGGLYRSTNGGSTWNLLYRCYCRAVWVDPSDASHIILGPADGVSRNGRIEESRDGGKTWQPASAGMQVPWPRHMVERFVQVDAQLMAVLSNGELWSTRLDDIQWRQILPNLAPVTAVAAGEEVR